MRAFVCSVLAYVYAMTWLVCFVCLACMRPDGAEPPLFGWYYVHSKDTSTANDESDVIGTPMGPCQVRAGRLMGCFSHTHMHLERPIYTWRDLCINAWLHNRMCIRVSSTISRTPCAFMLTHLLTRVLCTGAPQDALRTAVRRHFAAGQEEGQGRLQEHALEHASPIL